MRAFTTATVLALTASAASAFTASPLQQQQRAAVAASTTSVSMGLFDFFSEEARQERERQRQLEIEEQERMQKVILARRRNPELMEEYERKVSVRRKLKAEDRFEEAAMIDQFEEAEDQTLLDGTKGTSRN